MANDPRISLLDLPTTAGLGSILPKKIEKD